MESSRGPRASRFPRLSLRLARKKSIQAAFLLLCLSLVTLCAAWLLPLPERLSQPHSVVVEYRDGMPAYVFLAPDERWRVPTMLEEVDPTCLQALLALEDKRFHWHVGVDPIAVVRAAVTNVLRGRRVSGASTLTMQLVRVLEPRPRTLTSKLIESLRATQLELRLSKRELLSAYLQFVPYGSTHSMHASTGNRKIPCPVDWAFPSSSTTPPYTPQARILLVKAPP